ncbi:unnamed protein product [Protopolystoma xenopodis]|uniref:Uncharacterized protein n=1 Tax=Protopolystoma xenopodis TaxID=117903 RepID=A0A3S4ZL70_9PLAT|nr:unnamed protein product [Protopolystoma xenopodis]
MLTLSNSFVAAFKIHAAGLPNGTTFSTGLGSPMGGFTLTRLFNGTMTAMPHPHVSPSTIHQTPGGPGQLPLSLSGHIPGTAGLTLPAFSTGGANLSPSSSTPNTASNATFSFSPSPSLMPPVSAALIGPAGSAHSGLTAISSFSPAQLQPSMTGLLIPATLGKPTMPSSVFTAALPVNIGNNSNTMNAPQTGLTRLAPSPVGGRPRQTVTSNKRDSIPPSANTAELLRRLDDQIGILQRMASRTALQNTRLTQLVDVRAQLLKASSTSYSSPPASSSNPSSSSAPSPSSFNTTSDTILRDAMPLGPRMLPTGPVGPSVSVASPAMTSPCGAPGKPASAQARQNTCVGLVMAQTPVTASVVSASLSWEFFWKY